MGNFPSVIQPSSVHAFVGAETSRSSDASSKSVHKMAPRGSRCQRNRRRASGRPTGSRGKATSRKGNPINSDFLPNNPNMKIELLFTETYSGTKNMFSDNCESSKEVLELDQSELSVLKGRGESEALVSDFNSDPKLVMLYTAEPKLVKEHECKATMTRKVGKNTFPECQDEIPDNLRKVMRMEARRLARVLGDPTIPARLNHALELADAVLENSKLAADCGNKSDDQRQGLRRGRLNQQSQNIRDTRRRNVEVEESESDEELNAEERQRRRYRNEPQNQGLKALKRNTEFVCVAECSSLAESSESSEVLSTEKSIMKRPESDHDGFTVAGRSDGSLVCNRYQEKARILHSNSNVCTNSVNELEKSADNEKLITVQIKDRCDESDCDTSESWESEVSGEDEDTAEETEETCENDVDDAEAKLTSESDVNDKCCEMSANSLTQDGGPQSELCAITEMKLNEATLKYPVVSKIPWQTLDCVSIQRYASSSTKGSHLPLAQGKKVGKKVSKSIKKISMPSSKAPVIKYVPVRSRFVRYYLRKPIEKSKIVNSNVTLEEASKLDDESDGSFKKQEETNQCGRADNSMKSPTVLPAALKAEVQKRNPTVAQMKINPTKLCKPAKQERMDAIKMDATKEKSLIVNSKGNLDEAAKPIDESSGSFKVQPKPTTRILLRLRRPVMRVPKVKAKMQMIVPSEEIKQEGATECDRSENSIKSSNLSEKCTEVPKTGVQKMVPIVAPVRINPTKNCQAAKQELMDAIKNTANVQTAITNKENNKKLEGQTVLKKFKMQSSKNKKAANLSSTLKPNKVKKPSEMIVKNFSPGEKPNKNVKINKPVEKNTNPKQVVTKRTNKKVVNKESASTIFSRKESSEISTHNFTPVKETKSSVTYTIADRKVIPPLEKTQVKWLEDLRRRKENLKIRKRQLAAEKIETAQNKQLCIQNNFSDVEQIVRKIDYLEAVDYFEIPPFPNMPAVDVINSNKTFSNFFSSNTNEICPIRIEIMENAQDRPFGFAEKPLSKVFRFSACRPDKAIDSNVAVQTNRGPAVWNNNVMDENVRLTNCMPGTPTNDLVRPTPFKRPSKECSRPKINCKKINKEIVRQERVEKKENERKRQMENLVRKKTGLDISENLFNTYEVDEKSARNVETITLVKAKTPKMATQNSISWDVAERLTIGSILNESKETKPPTNEDGHRECIRGVYLVDADSEIQSSIETDARSRKDTDQDLPTSEASDCGSQDLLVTFKRENFESWTSGSNTSETAFVTDSNKSTSGFGIRGSVSFAGSSDTEKITVKKLNIADNESVSIEESTETDQLSDRECHDDDRNEEVGVTSGGKSEKKEKTHFFRKILNFRRKKNLRKNVNK